MILDSAKNWRFIIPFKKFDMKIVNSLMLAYYIVICCRFVVINGNLSKYVAIKAKLYNKNVCLIPFQYPIVLSARV